MAILKIRTIGDPVLRTKAKKVDKISDNTKKLIENMAETMYDAPGVGLAAPQVGILQQIVVADADDGNGLIALINPEIVSASDEKAIMEEGCLSVPGEVGDVIRPERIKVQYINTDGKKVEIDTGGLLARILQHEIDHLNGVLYVDKVTELGG
ncbi:MAG: peptide deformylase [Halanaerobiaceae bacterium]